jgi:multidrug resistance efflux pump
MKNALTECIQAKQRVDSEKSSSKFAPHKLERRNKSLQAKIFQKQKVNSSHTNIQKVMERRWSRRNRNTKTIDTKCPAFVVG